MRGGTALSSARGEVSRLNRWLLLLTVPAVKTAAVTPTPTPQAKVQEEEEPDLSYLIPFWLLWFALLVFAVKLCRQDRTLEPLRSHWNHASMKITKHQHDSDPVNSLS